MERVRGFILGWRGSKITADCDCSHEIKKDPCSLEEIYYQPRQHIKNRDITLLTEVCLVKSMCHVRIWELDHKEGWTPKNWYFCTVVLEKTLQRSLDCKEIKPFNPKWNQSWFIIRTDVEAETPILWQPDTNNWLTGIDPDAGKDWRGRQRMRGLMASPARLIQIWANSRSWSWPGKPVCSSWSQEEPDMPEWNELNWSDKIYN